MLAQMTQALDFHTKALVLRADRQRLIASNIANADTPGYVGRDLDFKAALADATQQGSSPGMQDASKLATAGGAANRPGHIPLQPRTAELGGSSLQYTTVVQPAMDNNSVDLNRERAAFVDNAVRYEATLRFINGQSKTLLSAIQGQ